MSSSSLKGSYAKWLYSVLLADVCIALLFLVPGVPSGGSLEELGSWRLIATVVIPVVVLLLVDVLPAELKSLIVYWKPYGWLPGAEAFTKYVFLDPRIDPEALAQHVGAFPSDSRKQNSRWYQLYKLVENSSEVADAQRRFLLHRDLAVLSLPFIFLAPVLLFQAGASPGAQWLGAALFALQFLLTALTARHAGIRFVSSVLAVHSARPVPGSLPG